MHILLGTLLTLAFLALGLWLMQRWPVFHTPSVPIRWVQAVFLFKFIAGMALWAIYTFHYPDRSTADIYKYFDDAQVMHAAISKHPTHYLRMLTGIGNDTEYFKANYYDHMAHWYRPYGSSATNDTHTIIRFNALVRLLSFGHYPVHAVVMNFLSLLGLTFIFQFLARSRPHKARWLFAAVMLLPGVLFWGSGVLKEGMLFFAIGLLLRACTYIVYVDGQLARTALLAPAIALLLTVKSYALALVPMLYAMSPYPHVGWRGMLGYWVLILAFLTLMGQFSTQLNLCTRLANKQHEFINLANGGTYFQRSIGSIADTVYVPSRFHTAIKQPDGTFSITHSITLFPVRNLKIDSVLALFHAPNQTFHLLLDHGHTGSRIHIPLIDGTVLGTLRAVPMAIVNALLRPFPTQVDSPFMALAFLENLLLFALLMLPFFAFDRNFDPDIVTLCLLFTLTILILTGLVTPVVGAIVRYKVPALPFLAAFIVHITDTHRIEASLRARFHK